MCLPPPHERRQCWLSKAGDSGARSWFSPAGCRGRGRAGHRSAQSPARVSNAHPPSVPSEGGPQPTGQVAEDTLHLQLRPHPHHQTSAAALIPPPFPPQLYLHKHFREVDAGFCEKPWLGRKRKPPVYRRRARRYQAVASRKRQQPPLPPFRRTPASTFAYFHGKGPALHESPRRALGGPTKPKIACKDTAF